MANDVSREIDWRAAHVNDDGSLTAPLRGEWDKDWNTSFLETVGYRMGETRGGVWGEVGLIRDAITVQGVESGSAAALRAFLESIVSSANTDVIRRRQANATERAKAAEQAGSQSALTEQFRSFADE